MYHAACKVELQLFNWSYSQPAFFSIYKENISIFKRIIFFPDDTWIQPTKTRLISGQSIY